MKWRKMGRICGSDTFDLPWFRKNAMVPTPVLRQDGRLRIYLGLCDANTVGRVGYVDVDPDDPSHILGVSRTPCLDIGARGTYDDNGVLPASLLVDKGKLYLFTSGYQLLVKPPYAIFGGLATTEDDGETFTRTSRTPLFERIDSEFSVRAATFCRNMGDHYRMWYCGGSDWVGNGTKDVPVYDLKTVTSTDLLSWPSTTPEVSIPLGPDECGLALPHVWHEDGVFKMIYSIRHAISGYTLGYGESPDGIRFTRMDQRMEIGVSAEGWDSEMICYGIPFFHKGRTYLFYCGNGYGTAGFGYAELDKG